MILILTPRVPGNCRSRSGICGPMPSWREIGHNDVTHHVALTYRPVPVSCVGLAANRGELAG
jgi:hypothetical protein